MEAPADDATALLGRLASGEQTVDEAVADAVARIEERNPALNAVIRTTFDARPASAAGGPLFGVPTLLKDLAGSITGEPLYQGNRLLRKLDQRATDDAPIARRLVDAGAVVLGRTNTPEFGAGVDTQPLSYGPTRNPWGLDRSVSGSSGGSAAAVASGMVAFAHGNDFGGSIRLPAAWCGVIGLKPGRGRISNSFRADAPPPGPMAEFFLTRSLRDAALLLDVVADGARGGSSSWRDALAADPPRPLRIGVLTAVDGVETDDACARAADDAGRRLAVAGHAVVALDASFLADERWDREWRIVRSKGARQRLDALATVAGRPLTDDDAEPLMRALAAESDAVADDVYAAAGQWQLDFAAGLVQRWTAAGLDALVSPTAGLLPRTLDELARPDDDPVAIYGWYRRIGCFAGPWNMVGFPAISIPWWRAGLPIGVQVVAALGREDLVLQLARQLTELDPDATTVRIAE